MQGTKLFSALAIALLLGAAPAAQANVEAGPIVNPANGHDYYLLAPDDWFAAEDEAKGLGGHLVAIDDPEENTWVWATFAPFGGPLWIGLSDTALEGLFRWRNGNRLSYTNWWTAGGEPNNAGGNEHWVELNNGLWNDSNGTSSFRAVVEVEGDRFFDVVEAEETPNPTEFNGVTDLAVSSDGANVYALHDTSPGDDHVLVYEREPNGALALLDSPLVSVNPIAIALTDDGSALFVVTYNGALEAWRRAPGTGLLTFADVVFDGGEGGNHLQFATDVATSPDSANVYVTGSENAVTTFAWDDIAGTLTLVDTDVNGEGGLVLSSGGPLVVTPDGALVVVVSQIDSALVVLTRNPTTGALTFDERFVDDANGVEGLAGLSSIAAAPTAGGSSIHAVSFEARLTRFSETSAPTPAIAFAGTVLSEVVSGALDTSADGTLLYVADPRGDRVLAYDRDPATGALGEIVASVSNGASGVDRLEQPYAIAASPDGYDLYVASFEDDAITVLTIPEPGAHAGIAALLGLRASAFVRASRRRSRRTAA